MLGHRSVHAPTRCGQKCVGSSSASRQDTQATSAGVDATHWVSKLVFPKPDGATTSINGESACSIRLTNRGRCTVRLVGAGMGSRSLPPTGRCLTSILASCTQPPPDQATRLLDFED